MVVVKMEYDYKKNYYKKDYYLNYENIPELIKVLDQYFKKQEVSPYKLNKK